MVRFRVKFELGFCVWRSISVDGFPERVAIDPPPTIQEEVKNHLMDQVECLRVGDKEKLPN